MTYGEEFYRFYEPEQVFGAYNELSGPPILGVYEEPIVSEFVAPTTWSPFINGAGEEIPVVSINKERNGVEISLPHQCDDWVIVRTNNASDAVRALTSLINQLEDALRTAFEF